MSRTPGAPALATVGGAHTVKARVDTQTSASVSNFSPDVERSGAKRVIPSRMTNTSEDPGKRVRTHPVSDCDSPAKRSDPAVPVPARPSDSPAKRSDPAVPVPAPHYASSLCRPPAPSSSLFSAEAGSRSRGALHGGEAEVELPHWHAFAGRTSARVVASASEATQRAAPHRAAA